MFTDRHQVGQDVLTREQIIEKISEGDPRRGLTAVKSVGVFWSRSRLVSLKTSARVQEPHERRLKKWMIAGKNRFNVSLLRGRRRHHANLLNKPRKASAWVDQRQKQRWIALRAMSALGRVSRVSPVHPALRNCTRDEGGPFGFGD